MGVVCNQQNNLRKRNNHLNNTTSFSNKNSSFSIINNKTKDYPNHSNIVKKTIYKEENTNDIINENNIDIALKKHNELRNIYGVEPLNLNNELCELAKKYAEECAETESLDHIPYLYKGNIIGENTIETNDENKDIRDMIQKWFGERCYYDKDKNQSHKFNNKASHFYQIIWKETKEVGFGLSQSQNKKTYFVAFYFPAGNIFNKFKENL